MDALDNGVFPVVAVVDSDGIVAALEEVWLSSSAHDIVEEDFAGALLCGACSRPFPASAEAEWLAGNFASLVCE